MGVMVIDIVNGGERRKMDMVLQSGEAKKLMVLVVGRADVNTVKGGRERKRASALQTNKRGISASVLGQCKGHATCSNSHRPVPSRVE